MAAAPALRQTWHALRGDGAWRDGRRIRVSAVADLSQALVFYSGLYWFRKAGVLDRFEAVCEATALQRGFGDFYGFVLVAQGSGDLMVEHGVHSWDVAALKPIVEEAGGRFSTWDDTRSIHKPDVVVSNGLVHDAALRVLAAAGR